jgi:acetate kinase
LSEAILALNAGSSTLKYALYRGDEQGETRLYAETLQASSAGHAALLEAVLKRALAHLGSAPSVVGHRVVHGGSIFTSPVRLDDAALEQLDGLVALAPLHLPPALALVRAALARFPDALHVGCFDTAFHQTLPRVASRFALPEGLYEQGVRRYGFHGLSYQYVVSALGASLPARLIVAHLGSGASMAAIRDGRSIDTTMGLTPSGGLPMGTRSGDLDPGILMHLQRRGHDVDDVENMINHQSGLLAIGGSSNMAELVARARSGDARARAGIEGFAYAIKKQIGAYAAALGGLDCLVFTGGIGEHVPLVRELSCSDLGAFGIELDPARNDVNAETISAAAARCQVRVIRTDEDSVIARSARAVARSHERS